MIVTINTDAAYHPEHKVAAFAFWIASDRGRICHCGPLRKKVSRPEQAEFKCILNAIYVLGRQEYKNITKIIINTDCLNVIHLIKKDKKKIQKYHLGSWGRHLVVEYELMMIKFSLARIPIEFRHVPSHTGDTTARSWVNDWCDRHAKQAMWKKINFASKI